MSYYREIRFDELVDWLEKSGYSEDAPHTLAVKLLTKFDILTTSNTAT